VGEGRDSGPLRALGVCLEAVAQLNSAARFAPVLRHLPGTPATASRADHAFRSRLITPLLHVKGVCRSLKPRWLWDQARLLIEQAESARRASPRTPSYCFSVLYSFWGRETMQRSTATVMREACGAVPGARREARGRQFPLMIGHRLMGMVRC